MVKKSSVTVLKKFQDQFNTVKTSIISIIWRLAIVMQRCQYSWLFMEKV